MTETERSEVVAAMVERLRPVDDVDGDYSAPIQPGVVRYSQSGAAWASWGDADGRWFRLMDAPSDPSQGFAGARVVFDADGRPLGSIDGPLMLAEVKGRCSAFCSNTGWNLASEICWSEVAH